MPVLPRPASAMAGKRPTKTTSNVRPSTSRAQSIAPARSAAASPTGSNTSMSTSLSQPKSSPRHGGSKRKERDFDGDGEETNINVVVRCRGRSDREVRENSGVVVSTDGVRGRTVDLSMGPSALSNKTYHFDKVFSPAADQSIIYDDVVAPIVDEMLSGYNCTIFAYGQTGTGKTYTMSGDMSDSLGLISDAAGVIPRVLNSLFRKLEMDEAETSVKCSFIELYNEELRDLISPDDGVKLKIYEEQKKGNTATMVQGMEEAFIKTAADGIKLLQSGSHKRQVAATKCNDLSSRSHTVFTVTAYIKRTTESGEDFVSAGKLNLVDLAGSENIQRSGAENKRAAEAGLINKSLLTLGRVINALVERSSHIPYRESKLTRLLQDSLGGRTKTCIIATISPAKSNLEETISTLDYAFRAKNIKNKPQVNQLVSKKTMLREFTTEIEKLRSELVATRLRNGVYLTAESYDEMVGENESRRILSEEQAQRIETMEISLRNKVQELFTLTNTFTSLKRDNESTKHTLNETKNVLDRTEMVLADTRQNLANETVLRKAHQSTEGRLVGLSETLLGTLDKTVRDVGGMHSKDDRRVELHDLNRATWERSQNELSTASTELEARLSSFESRQADLIASLSNRMEAFVREEVNKLASTQDFLNGKVASFEAAEKEVVEQSSGAKHEMNHVLEEIKVLREDVKTKVGEGLNGLSAAAGRISAEVINELGSFHTQLHTSYSSLGKDFKNVFEDFVKQINAQKAEAENMRRQMATAANTAALSQGAINSQLEACLENEKAEAAQDRQRLLSQITSLIQESGKAQDDRLHSKVNLIIGEVSASRSKLETSEKTFNEGMDEWVRKESSFVEEVMKSREALKMKMKEDWKAINEHNTTIQNTTRSVHEETVRIVDVQMQDMASQMQALDDFVKRARSQNERHHQTHVESLHSLGANVSQSYSSVAEQFAATNNRIREVGGAITSQASKIRDTLPSLEDKVKRPLHDLAARISAAPLREYQPTGETPRKMQYEYSQSVPRTARHETLLAQGGQITEIPEQDVMSPCKSPSKAVIYTDSPDQTDGEHPPTTSPTKNDTITNTGLREVNLNVNAAALSRSTSDSTTFTLAGSKSDLDALSMAPPPLKRQATESKLPTKLASNRAGIVRLEGRENMVPTAGRRLRNSPTD